MEKRIRRNKIFCVVVIGLAAQALMLTLWPVLRLTVDAAAVYLRSWGVLPGIGEVFWRTVLLLTLVLLVVLPLSALVTLWMAWNPDNGVVRRVRRVMRWYSHLPAVFVGVLGFFIIGSNTYLHDSLMSMVLLLSFMFLPFTVYRLDDVMRALPKEYVMAGQALGGRPMAVLLHIQLPQARHQILRVLLMLIEHILSEATALLALLGAVMPNQVLATELFRLAWLGRKDAAVLAFGLMIVMMLIHGVTTVRWRREEEEKKWRYNWW